MQAVPGLIGMLIVYIIFMLILVAGYVLTIIIGWKFMKAHESLASSVKELITVLKPKD